MFFLKCFSSSPTREETVGIIRKTMQRKELFIPITSTKGSANPLNTKKGVQIGSVFNVFIPTLNISNGIRKNIKESNGTINKVKSRDTRSSS